MKLVARVFQEGAAVLGQRRSAECGQRSAQKEVKGGAEEG